MRVSDHSGEAGRAAGFVLQACIARRVVSTTTSEKCTRVSQFGPTCDLILVLDVAAAGPTDLTNLHFEHRCSQNVYAEQVFMNYLMGWYRGTSLIRTPPPQDPAGALCPETYRDPTGEGFSYD